MCEGIEICVRACRTSVVNRQSLIMNFGFVLNRVSFENLSFVLSLSLFTVSYGTLPFPFPLRLADDACGQSIEQCCPYLRRECC